MLATMLFFSAVAAFQSSAIISGRVVDSITGEPIRKATVTLVPDTDRGPRVARFVNGQPLAKITTTPGDRGIVTDAAGNFRGQVSPGSYLASAGHARYVEYLESAKSVTVTAGETVSVTLKLNKHGVITGRVLDEDGEPIVRAMVQPLKWVITGGLNGQRTLMPQGGGAVSTNDLGEYRLYGLAPGKYLIAAQATYRASLENEAGRQAYTTVYFPSVTNVATAEAIPMAPGQTREGVDLRLSKVRVVRVQGKVGPLPVMGAASRGVNMMVQLEPRHAASPMNRIERLRSSPVTSLGDFDLTEVPAGSYTLIANIFGSTQDRRTARMNLEVGDRDVTGIALTLEPLLTLNGRFVAEDPVSFTGLTLHLRRSDGPSVGAYGRADALGQFSVDNLQKDTYQVQVNGRPKGYYVRQMRMGSLEVKDRLNLEGAGGELVVALEKGTAELTGRVMGPDQSPAKRVPVLLLSGQSAVMSTQTDDQGQYVFSDVPPGDYRVIASVSANINDADDLERLSAAASKVTLTRGGRERRDLELRGY
ncbi:MAG: carboxypeptidase regulatory-like domain-containing protein [Bryobacteraceae bacterium]|nr:carboxypeptidase regulatory-like domain-containing protein [Bryobacteraceae bacterium]